MEFRYFCRKKDNETWPMNGTELLWNPATNIKVPREKLSVDNGGCFGNGPGALDFQDDVFTFPTELFIQPDTQYIFQLEVRKGTRVASFSLDLSSVESIPPIMHVEYVYQLTDSNTLLTISY